MLSELSYLQIFWIVQIVVYAFLAITSIGSGKHWDKSNSHRDSESKAGWLEFRKRPRLGYFIAFLFTIYIVWTSLSSCVYGTEPNGYFASLYNEVTAPKHATANMTCIYLALALYLAHITRRFYESVFVSIFSKRQVVGPLYFVFDQFHHVAAGLSLIAESPEFGQRDDCFNISSLCWHHLIAVAAFYFASKIHHNTHQHLATLRRNKSGHIVTTSYKIPQGSWFDKLQVSNPHYLAEIIIYISIGVTLGLHSTTWLYLTVYIIVNQIYLAYNTQQLYKYKFDDYPKDRKMLIPFLF